MYGMSQNVSEIENAVLYCQMYRDIIYVAFGVLFFQNFVAESKFVKQCLSCVPCRGEKMTEHQLIMKGIEEDTDWPPLSAVCHNKLKENSVETNV